MTQQRTPLAKLRAACGYTQETFADAAGVERSTVTRWETGVLRPLPSNIQVIARLLDVSARELDRLLTDTAEARAAAQRPGPASTTVVRAPSGIWDDPANVVAAVRALRESNTDSDQLDLLDGHVLQIVSTYEHQGPSIVAAATVIMRRHVHELLTGHQPLRLRRRLYRVGAQLSGLLGYMAVNTGQFRHAEVYCQEALHLAAEAEDIDLQVWVHGTRSFGAYYSGEYDAAYRHAVHGRELAPTSPQTIRLLANGEARALGQLGDHNGADAAIGRALELASHHDVPPTLTPCISYAPYGYARVAANAATAYLSLGDTPRVLRYTSSVEGAVEHADSDWSRALVRLDIATAVLQQTVADLEQAVTLGQQALAVTEHPIRSVVQRARALHRLMLQWSDDPRVRDYTDTLHSWLARPRVRAISAEPTDIVTRR